MNFVKCLYIIARYMTLIFQIFSLVVLATNFNKVPVPHNACLLWFYTQEFAAVAGLTALEATLIYALHGKNYRIGVLLLLSLTAKSLCNIVFSLLLALDYQGNALCVSEAKPRWILPPTIATFWHQLLIWGLTFRKWSDLHSLSTTAWRIAHIVMRDGTWVMVCILAMGLMIIPYDILIGPITHVAFGVMCPAYSSATCRLILNIQRLGADTSNVSEELTTIAAESTDNA
ncbi:hypothetical protein AMATHDRAFT_5273 [Amanita thiersii Skay4041]|uniref:Uncharacterized protein n=1 Tax=Amanita thiersii Skay4041 TaxID=703135 RepID=A0A2A9NL21_9AGAR|nr:hypothetical protein AMATHDRAFT_5273 [Amanita thiersii Skay4041]